MQGLGEGEKGKREKERMLNLRLLFRDWIILLLESHSYFYLSRKILPNLLLLYPLLKTTLLIYLLASDHRLFTYLWFTTFKVSIFEKKKKKVYLTNHRFFNSETTSDYLVKFQTIIFKSYTKLIKSESMGPLLMVWCF